MTAHAPEALGLGIGIGIGGYLSSVGTEMYEHPGSSADGTGEVAVYDPNTGDTLVLLTNNEDPTTKPSPWPSSKRYQPPPRQRHPTAG